MQLASDNRGIVANTILRPDIVLNSDKGLAQSLEIAV
jgi:hypothetical protein